MPTPTKGHRLGGSPAHERHILANLATALFQHGRITTTEAKARRLRPVAERLITFAKRGDLHARRHVLTVVTDKGVVHQLFTEIAPEFSERDGGYTRITKIGPRKGDNAAMAVIELVRGEPVAAKPRRRARRADPRLPPPPLARPRPAPPRPAPPPRPLPSPSRRPRLAEAVTDEAIEADEATEADEAADGRGRGHEAVTTRPTSRGRDRRGGRGGRRRSRRRGRRAGRGRLTPDRSRWAWTQEPGTVRLRIDLAYDGSGFSGWAAQPGRRTVEDVVAAALGRVLRLPVPPGLTVAGRTDAGVHARGQVVHADVPAAAWAAVQRIALVPAGRGAARRCPRARRGPGARRVRRAVLRAVAPLLLPASATTRPGRSAARHETLWSFRRLDLAAMNEAARYLAGRARLRRLLPPPGGRDHHPGAARAGLAPGRPRAWRSRR